MQDEVLSLAGDTSTEMRNKVKTWLNDSQLDLAKRIDIPSLEAKVTVTPGVVAGEDGIDLPERFFRELTVTILGTQAKVLAKTTLREIDRVYPDLSQLTAAIPNKYYIVGQVYSTADPVRAMIRFVPIQDATYNVRVRYVLIPTNMSADADFSQLGFEYNQLMIDYASFYALKELNNPMWQEYKADYIEKRTEVEWRVRDSQSEDFRSITDFYGSKYD